VGAGIDAKRNVLNCAHFFVQFIVLSYPSVVLVCCVVCINWGAVISMVLFAKASSETWSQNNGANIVAA